MQDPLRIDSHKLMYHPQRVAEWLEGKLVYPIYMEIAPTARCQHKCSFCAFDFLARKDAPLISEVYAKLVLEQAADLGLLAVMFAGEGEPFLHPSINELISYAFQHGLSVAATSNGLKFTEKVSLNALPFLQWIRISLDAGSAGTYSRIHGCPPSHFGKVVANLKTALALRRERGFKCTIGLQALLLPQNRHELIEMLYWACELEADYLIIKPFSHHPRMGGDFQIDYREETERLAELDREWKVLRREGEHTNLIIRERAMESLYRQRPYKDCYGTSFFTYLDAGGWLYPCSAFLGDTSYAYGNIYEECFPAIWEGERRQRVLARLREGELSMCREICRLDPINRYLWELKHKGVVHVNFI